MVTKRYKKAQTLILIIITLLIFSFLGVLLANLESSYLESFPLYYRSDQLGFIGDVGLDRGKELIQDGDYTTGDPPLREYITIPPGGIKFWYEIDAIDLGGGKIKLIVDSGD